MGEETPQGRPYVEIKAGGLCSSCGEPVAEEGKRPGNFCQSCGAKLKRQSISEASGGKTEVFVSKGAVEMRDAGGGVRGSQTLVDSRLADVEENPAGRHDADAVRAALKDAGKDAHVVGGDAEEDETVALEVDEDGEIKLKGPYRG